MAEKPYTVNATKRPDGTWRKERRVKDGYVPPDEAVKFESKGTKFVKSIPKIPPGSCPVDGNVNKPKLTKNQKKNERKKQKRKDKADGNTDSITESIEHLDLSENIENDVEQQQQSQLAQPSSNEQNINKKNNDDVENIERTKRAKVLRKKLKQIKELENKKANGEIKEYALDQLEKISKKVAFEEEFEDLQDFLAI